MTPYVPSPSSHQNRYRKCLTHVVSEHETLAGIALKYDLTVEDLRRNNSFLWTTNSVWVGQTLKIPILSSHNLNQQAENAKKFTEQQTQNLRIQKQNRKTSSAAQSPEEFWTKVDDSIEASKKVTKEYKKQLNNSSPEKEPKDLLKC